MSFYVCGVGGEPSVSKLHNISFPFVRSQQIIIYPKQDGVHWTASGLPPIVQKFHPVLHHSQTLGVR